MASIKGVKVMVISYRDNLGVVVEKVDEYGVDFSDGFVFFNDKKIEVSTLVCVKEGGNDYE